MNPSYRMRLAWASALVAVLSLLPGCGNWPNLGGGAGSDYQVQLQAEAEARENDPAWKPSHSQVAVIKVAKGEGRSLNNFCLGADGNVIACVGGSDDSKGALEVYDPEGRLVQTWPVPLRPQAACLDADATLVVAGGGQMARLDRTGKVLATAKTPAADLALPPDADLKDLATRFGDGTPEARLKSLKQALTSRRAEVTGIAVSSNDVFLACPSTKDWSYTVYRLDREFHNPQLIVEKLSGCCGQMDIQARDGKLWVAHNGRHRVQCHDRDGKLLASFGREDRKAAEGFGGCCEPKNLRLAANGEVLASESGPPVAVKRFAADGRFLGVVALPAFSVGCVRSTVDVSPDGQRYYVLNGEERAIHVFAAKN